MAEYLSSPEIALPLLLVGLFCVLRGLTSWVAGVQLLVIVMVFGGIVGARAGNTAVPIIFRDACIVLPAYAAFASSKSAKDALASFPTDLALSLSAFLIWILVSLFNPEGGSGLRLLVGLKVWVFYLPFLLIGIALAARQDAMFRIFRVLLVCGLAACGVGLLQAMLIRLIGYQAAIGLFFGNAAASATQGFSAFYVGGNIYRIPGTFSFGSQYVAFLFLFITVAVIEANTDPDPRFRKIGLTALYVGILAGLFSGTKGAFLMYPLFVLSFFVFGLIRTRLLIAAPIAVGAGIWAIGAAGLDPLGLVSFGAEQAAQYSKGFIFQQVADAIQYGALGHGIGSSTGAARFVAFATSAGGSLGFESYFAKTAAEMGFVGLIILVIFLLLAAIRSGRFAMRHLGLESNRIVAPLAIYIAYVLVTSLKGSPLDVDPANVFFWLSLGLLLGVGRARRLPMGAQLGSAPAAALKEARAERSRS